MINFKFVLVSFFLGILFLVGCSDSEFVNSPSNDSGSNLSSLQKSSNIPVENAPPVAGTVVEGVSVPGISLGFTRVEIENAYGEPQWCQSNGNPGNQAYCSFPVDGGGQVNVHYRGADGGIANGTSDDVVFKIEWTEAVDGWITTAGVSTTLAKENPEAVIAAYPDAQVVYNQFGGLYSVIDYPLGIEIIWIPDFYTGQTHIQMAIFYPAQAPPPTENSMRVVSINLITQKVRGKRQVQAYVKVQDNENNSVRGANVIAHWTFPEGSTQVVEDLTSNTGNAYFEIVNVPRGIFSLTIDDVVLEGYTFDTDNSILSKSINVK